MAGLGKNEAAMLPHPPSPLSCSNRLRVAVTVQSGEHQIAQTDVPDSYLSELTSQLQPHFKPGFLQRDETIFQFRFVDGDPFVLTVSGDTFKFSEGEADEPTVTLMVRDHAYCRGLLLGSRDGMKAFMDGDYRADGNIVLSQLILYLFKPDDPTLIYEVKD